MNPRLRRNLSIALAVLIVVAACYGLVHALVANWSDVRVAFRRANWALLAGGLVGAMVAVVGLAQRWQATLAALGAPVPPTAAAKWFMTGQIGKYAPGGVWHIVGQGELAARGGVARRTAYASVMIATVTLIGGAAVVVAAGALAPGSARTPWWAVGLGGGIIVVLLEPHLLRALLRKAGVPDGTLSSGGVIRLVLGTVPTWLVIGVSSWMIARAFSDDLAVVRTVVGSITSWLVGIVTLPAPGGIGVREAVFARILRPTVGSGAAALIALMARMAFLVADVAWLALARMLPTAPVPQSAVAELTDDGSSPSPSSTASES